MSFFGPDERKQMKAAWRISAVGTELSVATLIGYFGGAWADQKLHTAPYLSLFGMAIGVAAGVRSLVRFVKKTDFDKL